VMPPAGFNVNSDSVVNTGTGGTGGTGGTTQTSTYTNPSPAFSFAYPSSWSITPSTSSSSEVVAQPASQSEEFVVYYDQGISASQYRSNFESSLGQQGTIAVQSDTTSTVDGVSSDQVVYSFTSSSTGAQSIIVAEYLTVNGFTYLIGYQIPNDNNAQANANQMDQIVSSFTFG